MSNLRTIKLRAIDCEREGIEVVYVSHPDDYAEAKKDAKLIAAAPKLLSLLEEISNPEKATAFISAIEQNDYSFDFEEWMNRVRAAIAKATK